jgi:hypothetical protein
MISGLLKLIRRLKLTEYWQVAGYPFRPILSLMIIEPQDKYEVSDFAMARFPPHNEVEGRRQ